MRRVVATIAFTVMMCGEVLAGTLNEREIAQLKAEIHAMYDAFERGDATPLIAKTHESIYELTGDREAFEKAARESVAQLSSAGIKFLSSQIGVPTQTYAAGPEEVCFIPRISIMEMQGKRAKSTGYLIAVRKLGTQDWKYLDGAGLRANPELLYQLFPELQRGIDLPEVSTVLL